MIGDTRDCPSPRCPGTQEITGTGPGVEYWECQRCGRLDRVDVDVQQEHPGQGSLL